MDEQDRQDKQDNKLLQVKITRLMIGVRVRGDPKSTLISQRWCDLVSFLDFFFPFVSFFVALHRPLSSLFQPFGVPSWINPFAPLVEIFSPLPTFGGSLLSLLQPLSGPS